METERIYIDRKLFESFDGKCDLKGIIEKSKVKHLVTIKNKLYCLSGAVGNGTGKGWRQMYAYEAVKLTDYKNAKTPLPYGKHTDEVTEGKRERSYDGLLIECQGEKYVLSGSEVYIMPEPEKEVIPLDGFDDEEANTVETEVDGFKYNVFGVCLNPEVVLQYGSGKSLSYEITVSKTRSGYGYGYIYSCNSQLANTGAGSVSPFIDSKKGFPTKEAAILHTAKHLLKSFEEYMKRVPQLKKREKDLSPLKKLIQELSVNNENKISMPKSTKQQIKVGSIGNADGKNQQFKMVPLDNIEADENQPRKFYNEVALQELTASVKSKGVLQPILIRPIQDKHLIHLEKVDAAPTVQNGFKDYEMVEKNGGPCFMVVCGERRFRAAKAAGLDEIPAVIRELSNEETLELQIIENLQRKDVHPMEEAVAFKSLGDKFSPEELALRVGKSASYVAKRIKLNDLTEEEQEIFFADRMTYSQALLLSRMEPAVQKEIIKDAKPRDEYEGWKLGNIEWAVNRASLDLSKAIFDTTDAELYPEMGACTSCPFNSSNQPLLFDDDKKSICSKPSCFSIKTHRIKKQKFEEVAANPDIICIANSYLSDDEKATLATAKDAGIKVLDERLYYPYYGVEPTLTFDEWVEDGYNYDEENLKDEKVMKKAKEEYEEYVQANEQELKEQQEKIDSGAIIKAYVVAGHQEGQERLIKLRPGSKETEAIMSGNIEDAEILSEISQIEARERRNKELDAEKVWTEIMELYEKEEVREKLFTAQEFTEEEINALSFAMASNMKYDHRNRWGVNERIRDGENRFNESGMREMARMFLHSVLVSHYGSHLAKWTDNQLVYSVLKSYLPFEIELIEENQNGIAEQRAERVKKRIEALRKKLQSPVEQ